MGGKASKDKGANYERLIAKVISEWSGLSMRRTPLSGGWVKQNPNVSGDLVCIDPEKFFPFHIECKNQKNWHWGPTMCGKGVVYDWWDQTVRECPADKKPWLIFHEHGRSDWIMMRLVGSPHQQFKANPYPRIIVEGEILIFKLMPFLNAYDHSAYGHSRETKPFAHSLSDIL